MDYGGFYSVNITTKTPKKSGHLCRDFDGFSLSKTSLPILLKKKKKKKETSLPMNETITADFGQISNPISYRRRSTFSGLSQDAFFSLTTTDDYDN